MISWERLFRRGTKGSTIQGLLQKRPASSRARTHGLLEAGNGLSSYRCPGSGLGLFSPLTPSACPGCGAPILMVRSRPHSNWVTLTPWHWLNNPICSFKTPYWVLERIRGTTLNHRDTKANKTVPLSCGYKLDKELSTEGEMVQWALCFRNSAEVILLQWD